MIRKSHLMQGVPVLTAMLSFLTPVFNVAAGSLEQACATADPVALNSTVRGYGSQRNAMHVFSLDVRVAGMVALDVTVPGSIEASPKVGFLGRGCSASNGDDDSVAIERAVGHRVIALDPGTYFFRLAAQDPRSALGEYKLTIGFVTAWAVDEALKTEPDIVDPDPGVPFFAPPPLKTEPDIVDPDPGVPFFAPPLKTEPDIVDPDPGIGSISPVLSRRLPGLCQHQRLDDHAATVTCATALSLGHQVTAEIANGWGDDADVFTFTLTRAQTLQIASAGSTETFGVLYDRFGQRLATDDGGELGGNFRIVKTLAAGRYFLQVEGRDRAEGAYGLTVDTLDW